MKIVIMDDEYFFRQAIKKYLVSEREKFEIVGEAKNGQEGIKLINELHPDIALVDINMPIFNGIEVLERIKRDKLGTKVIILTGYDMFEYAQQSIRLGVQDYLLKPVEKEQLLDSLEKVVLQIEKETNYLQEKSNWAFRNFEVSLVMREHFLHKVIHADGEQEWNEIEKLAEEYAGILERDIYQVGIISIYYDEIDEYCKGDESLYNFLITNILAELFEKQKIYCMASVSTLDHHKIYFLLSSELSCNDVQSEEEKVFYDFEQIVSERMCEVSILVSIGGIKSSKVKIPDSYEEASSIDRFMHLYQKRGIFYYSQFDGSSREYTGFSSVMRRHLMTLMRSDNMTEIEKMLNDIFDNMEDRRIMTEDVYRQSNEIVLHAYEVAKEATVVFKSDSDEVQMKPPTFLSESISELRERVLDYVLNVTRIICKHKNQKQRNISENIIRYIDNNYKNPFFSIEKLSREFGMSKTSLHQYFKQVSSITINEYLIQMRMDNAKRMFDEGYRNISFVAEESGYIDAGYFSKRFKKLYGVSPSDYINMKKN